MVFNKVELQNCFVILDKKTIWYPKTKPDSSEWVAISYVR